MHCMMLLCGPAAAAAAPSQHRYCCIYNRLMGSTQAPESKRRPLRASATRCGWMHAPPQRCVGGALMRSRAHSCAAHGNKGTSASVRAQPLRLLLCTMFLVDALAPGARARVQASARLRAPHQGNTGLSEPALGLRLLVASTMMGHTASRATVTQVSLPTGEV